MEMRILNTKEYVVKLLIPSWCESSEHNWERKIHCVIHMKFPQIQLLLLQLCKQELIRLF